MLRHLVYLAHGSRDFVHECCFSIASVQRLNLDHVHVHVFTDQKKYMQEFVSLPVTWHEIDNNIIEEWRGEIDFVHRVKIKVLQTLCNEVRQGPVLYLDTDVFATQPFHELWEKIENGYLMMHTREGNIIGSSVPISKKIVPLIRNAVSEGILQTSDFDMWNSGVLGFMAEKSYLLEEVLLLTDTLYVRKRKHIIEQVCFSYVFQQRGDLLATDDVFYHYWELKEFRQVLKDLYALPSPQMDQLVAGILRKNMVNQLSADRKGYYSYPFNKLKKLLIRARWKIPLLEQLIVDFKLL